MVRSDFIETNKIGEVEGRKEKMKKSERLRYE